MIEKNQTSRTYENIRQKIITGEYPPLVKLHEMDLAAQYSVSRNTIKKALLMLERENLVNIEVNKGATVKSFSVEEVKEFLDLRATLERFIVGKTVPVISEEALGTMQSILDTMKKFMDQHNLLEYSKNNLRFHDVIYSACPNHTAVEMTLRLKLQMRKYNTKTILVPGRDVNSFAEHSAIFKAFKKRNTAEAEALVEQHILNVKKTLEENISLLFL
ncbi:GntR family transcriptional regulator [Spirochaetia bacterium]|nr:GntR family transcriptional regulator [Spirochaetia bacterium]